jgi:hypothetical protein
MNERKPILELVASLGYAVSVHRVNGKVDMQRCSLTSRAKHPQIFGYVSGAGGERTVRVNARWSVASVLD